MTWLLRLYPRTWRRRYGAEVEEILAGRTFSFRTTIDLVAGAIDVWLHPVETLAAAAAAAPPRKDDTTMLNRILRFDCAAAYGPDVTREDAWKAGVSMILTTLVLTIVWMALHVRLGDDAVVDAFGMLPFMIGMVVSMRYTYLKGRPAAVQAIFIGGLTAVLIAIFAMAGLLTRLLP